MAELIPRVAKTYAITKTVTFDVDGTLIHTAALHAQCLIVALQNSDVDMPSEDMCGQRQGRRANPAWPYLTRHAQQLRRGDSDVPQQHVEARLHAPHACFSGCARDVRADQSCASESRGCLVRNGRGVEQYKQVARIADLVDDVTPSDDAQRSKPFPSVFRAALAKLALLRVQDEIGVGDTLYDADSAAR